MAVTLQFIGDGGSLMGKAIEWFSQGLVCHVDAVMPDGSLAGAQMDSGVGGQPSGFFIRPVTYTGPSRRFRITLPATSEQERDWYAFHAAQIGKPYDLAAIGAFVAGRDWRDNAAWFCSEEQAAALEECGIIRRLFAPANKITPEGLLLALSILAEVVELPAIS